VQLKNEIDGDVTLTVEDNNIEHDDTANNDQENDDVNETVIHEKTILETSMKPIKNEISNAVTDAKADEQSLDESKEVLEKVQAPLASEESDPAPLASLESANSSDLQSMWNFFEKRKKNLYLPSVISAQCASCRCAKKLFEMFDSNCRWLPALHDFMHFCNNFMDDDHKILNYRVLKKLHI